MLVFTGLLSDNEGFMTIIGSLSSGVEALLGIPQFVLNYQRKSTQGLT
jgi:hypothetical protein